jgi:anti-sigma factor RsiW
MSIDDRMRKLQHASERAAISAAGCGEWGHAVSLYIDGELGEADRAAFEEHFEGCSTCRGAVQYARAFRTALRTAPTPTPGHLRAKIRLAVADEAPASRGAIEFLRRLWSPMPVAAAGATALGITAWLWAGPPADDITRELAEGHSRRLPLEMQSSDPRMVEAWANNMVNFHLRVPRLVGHPLSLLGARLWNVRNRSAIYLVYGTPQSPTHRVTMLVYEDPSGKLPAVGVPKKIDDHDVYVANRAGYNVAVWKKDEVVYSLVSDRADDVPELVHAADQN